MDIMGVLGDPATTLTVGTTTAYTCPSGKAARVKLMYKGVSAANSTLAVAINGITIFTTGALTATQEIFSTTALMVNTGAAGTTDGSTIAKTVGVGPNEYWLGPGDVISYTIGTLAMTSLNFQVVGVEVDIT